MEPTIPPPPGFTSNFVNPPSRANVLVTSCLICIVLSSIFVWGRLYSRIRFGGTRSLAWDDIVCIFAAAGCVAYAVFCILGTRIGNLGTHMWDIPKGEFAEFTLVNLVVAPILYGPFIFLTKLTIFLLYYRIFKPIRWMRHAVCIGITVTLLFYAVYTTMITIWCTPDMGTSWTNFFANPAVQARCRKSDDLSTFQSGFNIISDFYILLLPVPVLRHLNLRAIAKLGVTLIFAAGLMACTGSASGIYYRLHTRDNGDFTWQTVPSQIAMVFEMNIGVICSCMPSVAVLIRYWFKSTAGWNPSPATADRSLKR